MPNRSALDVLRQVLPRVRSVIKWIMRLGHWIVGAILVAMSSVRASVERVEILSRSPVLQGRAFGSAGSYEKIAGRVHFKVHPGDPHNRIIVDLDKAPRTADGS